MGNFIESNLMPGEKIVYKAQVHWMVYLQAFGYAIISAIIIGIGKFQLHISTPVLGVLAGTLLFVGAYRFVLAYLHTHYTEMGITDRRIIAKFGVIRRETIEIPLVKIESVMIGQSVVDRLLDSGSVAVSGTGSAMAPVRFIDKPVEFRNKLNEAIARAKESAS